MVAGPEAGGGGGGPEETGTGTETAIGAVGCGGGITA